MKRKLIMTVFMTLSAFIVNAQGIQFIKGLTWEQILNKAKTEHKYIFVDCYATWCGPCKEMEKIVYPLAAVGDAYNKDFISIKMQMDETAQDNDTVKNWYATASMFKKDYQIQAYPTFLFFDENGRAIHMATGSLQSQYFIQLAKDAQDSHKQYYTLLSKYRDQKLSFTDMPMLADEANGLGDQSLSQEVEKKYVIYLEQLNERQFLTQNNINFLNNHRTALSTNDRLFILCRAEPAKIDTVMHSKSFAHDFVHQLVDQEDIQSKFEAAERTGIEPNWKQISFEIKNRYGSSEWEDNILVTKVNWYQFKKDGSKYTYYLAEWMEECFKKAGVRPNNFGDLVGYNNAANDIFLYDPDKKEIKEALQWIVEVNKKQDHPNPNTLDTQAALLYKLGRKEEALIIEKQAITLDPKNKDIQDDYSKMQSGEITWKEKME